MITKNYGVRIDPELKEESSRILDEIGIAFPDAIRLFLKQVVNRGGLPIELKTPNAVTLEAIKELEEAATPSAVASEEYLQSLKELAS